MSATKGGAAPAGSAEPDGSGQNRLGTFRDMDAAVNAAQAAFLALDKLPLVKRDEIIASIRKAALRESDARARPRRSMPTVAFPVLEAEGLQIGADLR